MDASDLDADGDPDWAYMPGGGGIVWLENGGHGQFGVARVISTFTSGSPKGFVAANLDDDGDLDVLANRFGDHLEWNENTASDCNGNDLPDVCEPDCNFNSVTDECDLRDGRSRDCNRNAFPDECDTDCTIDCDDDGDRCLDELDCAPLDDSLWVEPSAVDTLGLRLNGSIVVLEWQPPGDPGGLAVRYDLLRSDAIDFASPACLESDEVDTVTEDGDPALVDLLYYLVRAENDCPGSTGNLGSNSAGVPRTAPVCP